MHAQVDAHRVTGTGQPRTSHGPPALQPHPPAEHVAAAGALGRPCTEPAQGQGAGRAKRGQGSGNVRPPAAAAQPFSFVPGDFPALAATATEGERKPWRLLGTAKASVASCANRQAPAQVATAPLAGALPPAQAAAGFSFMPHTSTTFGSQGPQLPPSLAAPADWFSLGNASPAAQVAAVAAAGSSTTGPPMPASLQHPLQAVLAAPVGPARRSPAPGDATLGWHEDPRVELTPGAQVSLTGGGLTGPGHPKHVRGSIGAVAAAAVTATAWR
jgi:hypothetical protein